jgi:hypothetical protein
MTAAQFLADIGIFLFATELRLVLGPNQLLFSMYWSSFLGVKPPDCEAIAHLHIMLGLRIPPQRVVLNSAQGQLYLYLLCVCSELG